jgi:vitamin B12 transporter
MVLKKILSSILSIMLILSFATSVFGVMSDEDMKNFMKMSKEERDFLLMYFNEDELVVVSATRSLKSITRIAENVEVVTAADIELMNAHTLVDVLNTINGVQIAFAGTSAGSSGSALIQGSRIDHAVVLVDGVSINDIAGGVPPINHIPAQIIERVEVIKGPASSVWGSSLGGIVNVITKSSPAGDGMRGLVSGSYGEKNSGDFRADVSGKTGAFGYYFFAGRLQTDGLRPRDNSWHNDIYSKLSYDITRDTAATFTLLYTKDNEGGGDFDELGLKFDSKFETLLSSLSVKSRLTDSMSLDVSARASSKLAYGFVTDLPSGDVTEIPSDDKKYGGSVRLDLRQRAHAFVFGADYDFLNTKFSGMSIDEKIAAVYLNDTISLGRLSVTPGLRLDDVNVEDTSLKKTTLSPSLGVTYEIADKTLIRGVVSNGFNIPPVFALVSDSPFFRKNPDLTTEKVWSYQVGIETGALKYVWLKATGFRHDIRDAIEQEDISVDEGTWTVVNKSRVRRQGVEGEIRTLPFYNFVLTAAASYIRSKDLETGEVMKDNPLYTYNFGIQYDDKKSLRGLIHGYYVWWNASDSTARYNAFIVDANVIKTLYKKGPLTVEAFLAGHNLFDGSSYPIENLKNARRWIEGGIRVKF